MVTKLILTALLFFAPIIVFADALPNKAPAIGIVVHYPDEYLYTSSPIAKGDQILSQYSQYYSKSRPSIMKCCVVLKIKGGEIKQPVAKLEQISSKTNKLYLYKLENVEASLLADAKVIIGKDLQVTQKNKKGDLLIVKSGSSTSVVKSCFSEDGLHFVQKLNGQIISRLYLDLSDSDAYEESGIAPNCTAKDLK